MPLLIFPLFLAALFGAMPHGEHTIAPRVQYAAADKVVHVQSVPTALAMAKQVNTERPTKTVKTLATSKKTVATAPAQTAAAATTQRAAPSTPAAVSTSLESAVISKINDARAAAGLAALTSDGKLTTIARGHSADMLANDYFSHESLSGCSAFCRYQNAGYTYWSMAENIYWMSGYTLTTEQAAQQIVESWQNSPGHRANDLGTYTHIGVGIAESGSKVYVTADFSTPR